jgi:hypothetical protein
LIASLDCPAASPRADRGPEPDRAPRQLRLTAAEPRTRRLCGFIPDEQQAPFSAMTLRRMGT